MPENEPRHRPLLWLAGSVIVFLAVAISSASRKSATYDEPVYIVAGLSYLTLGDYTMKDDAPPLVASLAGLSPLAHGLRIPGGKLPFDDSLAHEYPFAADLLYRSGADAESIVFWARLLVLVPFGLLLLFGVQAWSRHLFGVHASCMATFLVALSPNLIAHGRLVAADFPSVAAIVFASFVLYRFTEQPARRRALAAGCAVALALVTKYIAVILLPIAGFVVAVTAWRNPALRGRALLAIGASVLAPCVVLTTLIYGSLDPTAYWDGLGRIYRNIQSDITWYLFGEFYPGGTPYYYFGVLLVKTSAPLLLLGVASLFFLRKKNAGLLGELCLLLPAAAILAAATRDTIPGGLRRVLLVLPLLAISASRFAAWVPDLGKRALVPLIVLCGWHGASSVLSWPHYIPYFHELAGGRSGGHRLLDDSNIDWGQDLEALPAVLAKHGVEEVYLLYFGEELPEYHGIPHKPISAPQFASPTPGFYAISLNWLIRSQRTGVNWLERFEPIDRAGTSIWLYRFDR